MTALILLLAGPPLVEPAPIDLATITARDAERLSGRLVATPIKFVPVEAVQPDDGYDTYPVASDVTSERAIAVPSGADVQSLMRLVGVLVVTHHPPAVGAGGTVFPGFTEVVVVAGVGR